MSFSAYDVIHQIHQNILNCIESYYGLSRHFHPDRTHLSEVEKLASEIRSADTLSIHFILNQLNDLSSPPSPSIQRLVREILELIDKHLFLRDETGFSPIMLAVRYNQCVPNYIDLLYLLPRQRQIDLMSLRSRSGSSLLDLAAKCNQEALIILFKKLALADNKQHHQFRLVNMLGDLIHCLIADNKYHPDIRDALLEIIRKLEPDDLFHILSKRNSIGYNIVMLIVRLVPSAIQSLHELMSDFDANQIFALISWCNQSGQSAIHYAAKLEPKLFNLFLMVLKQLNPEQLRYALNIIQSQRHTALIQVSSAEDECVAVTAELIKTLEDKVAKQPVVTTCC